MPRRAISLSRRMERATAIIASSMPALVDDVN
jgi:hypothetical protein